MADVEMGGSIKMAKQEPGKVPSPLYPQHDEWTPWLVPTIIVANLVLFILAMYYNNCPVNTDGKCVARFLGRFSFQPLSENQLLGPSSATLEKMGASVWDKVVHGHQVWRLATCMWLHADVLHLLANMLSILFIGIRLERRFGYVRIGAIYIISGLGGSVLSMIFIRNDVSVGASGALFGLLGGMLSDLLSNWNVYTKKVAAVATLLFMLALNLVLGVPPHVNHIAGFLTGFLLGFVLLMLPHFGLPAGSPCTAKKYTAYQRALMAVALILVVAGFVIGLAMLFRGSRSGSTALETHIWCPYNSCPH